MGRPTDYKISYVNTKDLIPYANNSRTHSDDQVNQIASSINEFGFTNPWRACDTYWFTCRNNTCE